MFYYKTWPSQKTRLVSCGIGSDWDNNFTLTAWSFSIRCLIFEIDKNKISLLSGWLQVYHNYPGHLYYRTLVLAWQRIMQAVSAHWPLIYRGSPARSVLPRAEWDGDKWFWLASWVYHWLPAPPAAGTRGTSFNAVPSREIILKHDNLFRISM